MQYEKVPRKMPSVHCVTRSLEKLTMMRGENCMDARVSVISRMANTMDTTVMMEAAIPARMTWATCGSACEGNRTVGTQALAAGEADAVAFGVPFIANPDLPIRFAQGTPLNPPDPDTFYAPGPKGYTDYPALENAGAIA